LRFASKGITALFLYARDRWFLRSPDDCNACSPPFPLPGSPTATGRIACFETSADGGLAALGYLGVLIYRPKEDAPMLPQDPVSPHRHMP